MNYKRAKISKRGLLAAGALVVWLLSFTAPPGIRGSGAGLPKHPNSDVDAGAPAERNESDSWRKSLESWSVVITGLATVVVAAFTWRLWSSTDKLWKEAKESSGTALLAAKSAEASVTAVLAAERAYIFAEVHFGSWVPGAPAWLTTATVKFWNYGKTPAIITLIRATIEVRDSVPTELLNFPGSDRQLPPSLGIATSVAYPIDVAIDVSPADRAEVMQLNQTCYCFGVLEYEDVMGNSHRTGFCWQMYSGQSQYHYGVCRESPLNLRT